MIGSRVPVRRLWAFFKNGASVDTLLRRFPQIGVSKVLDALAFALDNPEVMEADLEAEHEMLARAGVKRAARAAGPEQIELPFGPVKATRVSENRRREGSSRSGS